MADLVPVTAIFGATASGKSALAHVLARAAGRAGEIVACDAVMVYRGFDIGANKPSALEQSQVRHHLLDVCEPAETMTAARYAELAASAIAEIKARGAHPIVVVGTFLYYRALVYGLSEMPPARPELRRALLEREAKEPGYLAREVKRCDEPSYREANGKNLPRLVRALEVFTVTGQRASDLRAAHGFSTPRYAVEKLGISVAMPDLRERIFARTQSMLQRGWVAEVKRLRTRVAKEAAPMRALGYAQVNDWLDRQGPSGDAGRGETGLSETDVAPLAQSIALATGQYARRQLSFLKKESAIEWRQFAATAAS